MYYEAGDVFRPLHSNSLVQRAVCHHRVTSYPLCMDPQGKGGLPVLQMRKIELTD